MSPRFAALLAVAVGVLGCVGNESPAGSSSNRGPQIRGISLSPAVVPVGGTALVKVDAIDPDGDRLFFRYAAQAGSVVPDAANPAQATYVHGGVPDQVSDVITVSVTDTRNASVSAERSVALQGNRFPSVRVSGADDCHPQCTVTFTAQADDPDGDELTYLWVGCGSGSERSVTCAVTGVGLFTATVVVSDGRGGLATASATAEGVNRAPVVTGGQDFVAARARFVVSESDPDGDERLCGWWGDCECTGSAQSFDLVCAVPGVSGCFQRFGCTDLFGASAETTFRLIQ